MDKREFLKITGMLAGSAMLGQYAKGEELPAHQTNWAGNLHYHAEHLYAPANTAELQELVRKLSKIRGLGSRHCFNTIADTPASQISLLHFDSMELDSVAHTATVGAGVRYGILAPWLDAKGYAVHNLASLPHITVAGAIATATHGSGVRNGNLTTAVSAIEFVTADGNIQTLSRAKDSEKFKTAVVHLGSIGIVTRVTLDVQPRFEMTQLVYQNLSFNELEHNLEAIMGSGYSVSLFTDWQKHKVNQVWIKDKTQPGVAAPGGRIATPPLFYNATAAKTNLHPIDGHSAINCTEQMGVPGPWYERMPHFKMNFTPSSGAELQTEYFVPRNRGYEAILAVESLHEKIAPHLFITELRSIAADDLPMSMAYQQDSLAIHFTWKPETPAVTALLPQIEAKLAPFNPRPHWGKVFTLAPEKIAAHYPKLSEYQSLIKELDPSGKFRNDFINHNIFNA